MNDVRPVVLGRVSRFVADEPGRRRRRTHVVRSGSVRPPLARRRSAKPSTDSAAITAVVVAVPARNEADHIARCLASIDKAAGRCALPVNVIVAADGCQDDTARIARSVAVSHVTVDVIEGSWHGAGCARAMAVEAATALVGVDPANVWIANTDADCEVPSTWLQRQLRYAVRGAVAVAGIVSLDPSATCEPLMAEFTARYDRAGATHRHVHAANLGVRADAYLFAGGWSTHTVVGEDHKLWHRLMVAGLDVVQPTDVTVITSSRTSGRVPGGFATALSRLEHHGNDLGLAAS